MFVILEALESDDENDEQEAVSTVDATYDHPEHVVTVTTISDVNLDGGKFACIGPNTVSKVTDTGGLMSIQSNNVSHPIGIITTLDEQIFDIPAANS